jgi:hypothetical protein
MAFIIYTSFGAAPVPVCQKHELYVCLLVIVPNMRQ